MGAKEAGAMRDTELYRQVLGLDAPWEVTRVELSMDRGKVDVWADHKRGTRMACPECGRELAVYDHGEERSWRHLDTCQFLTYLAHAVFGAVDSRRPGVQRGEPRQRLGPVLGTARILRLSWDETWHLMERAVARGLSRKPAREIAVLGVDEKSAGKGQDHI
jgi:hypothetical protein